LCVPSAVAPAYAPPGASLVSASVLADRAGESDARLEESVRQQLTGWFGPQVRRWRHLRTYRIKHALPEQRGVGLCTHEETRAAVPGVYVCGDYLDTASINGALRSGRLAVESLIEDATGEARGTRAA